MKSQHVLSLNSLLKPDTEARTFICVPVDVHTVAMIKDHQVCLH